MGCFLACFGGAKDRKQRRRARKPPLPPTNSRVNQSYHPLQASPSPQKPILKEVAYVSVPELRENQEQASFSSCQKKVTFDLNVKTYEDVAVHEDVKDALEDEEAKEEVKEEGKAQESKCKASPGSKYRYQNCESSDDEGVDDDDEGVDDDDDDGGEDYEESDFDDEEDEVEIVGTEEESYDSFFSLPMDKEKEKQQQNCQEVESPVPISVSAKGSARDRSQYVHSVLNPVENLSQWKEVKVRALPLKNPRKENINAELESKMKYLDKENSIPELETKVTEFSPEPTCKSNKAHNKTIDSNSTLNHGTRQGISVDASLSTWLVSSESSPKEEGPQRSSNSQWSNSSVSREEQPILGTLTVDDLKQSSVTSSPRRSPSRNPDDIPILGTVGSYWSTRAQNSDTKGIPNSTSKYREDKRVNWHSTPFEVRLERALNKGAAEACP